MMLLLQVLLSIIMYEAKSICYFSHYNHLFKVYFQIHFLKLKSMLMQAQVRQVQEKHPLSSGRKAQLLERTSSRKEQITQKSSAKLFNKNLQSSENNRFLEQIREQKSNLKCGIQGKYLNQMNYLTTCEFAKKRNKLYKNYCIIIQQYYIQFNYLYEKFNQKVKPNFQKTDKISFVKEFKSFFLQFFYIFHEVSSVYLKYFNEISEDFNFQEENLQFNTQELIQKLKGYEKYQKQFQQSFKAYSLKLSQIFSQYDALKKDEKDPYSFFNKKQLTKKCKQLLQNISKEQKTCDALNGKLCNVYKNSMQFQSNIVIYRQQLFTNKYKTMKKLAQMSKHAKNSLIQMLVYLFDCVSSKSQSFLKLNKQDNSKTNRKKSKSMSGDKMAVESYLIQITNDYSRMLSQIQSLLKSISQFIEELRKFTTNQLDSNKNILELLNAVYDNDENPNKQVYETLDFYSYFCKKICELNNGINIGTNELIKLRSQTKKLSEITMSLVRNNKTNQQKSQQLSEMEGNHTSQIDILLEKMSEDYPIDIINKVYKHFQETMSFLKNYASQKFHMKKRLVEDSMEISHLQETLVKPQKRPCKKEIWLWQKWQCQNIFKIDEQKTASLTKIKQFTNKLIEQLPQSKQIERFACLLESKSQITGFLIVTDKHIAFETSQGNCIIAILHSQIDDVKTVVRMFVKIIVLQTANGSLNFKGFINIQAALECIEEARTSLGTPVSKPLRSVIQITSEQLACFEQRKNKMKQILPKAEDFNFYQQIIIPNITIDHLYELIYSDNEVVMKGKKQSNFFTYFGKKNGVSNHQATKYDSIGPKFYTHQEGVTFLNCPSFSTRIFNYEVKLPPIPFVPKYAQNREQMKLFWISNEEFQYLIHNNTSGAPKSDTFFIQVFHKVQKSGEKDCKISFYWRVFFTQDSYLKSTIESNVKQETSKQISLVIVEMKKYCSQMSSLQTKSGQSKKQLKQMEDEEKQQGLNEKQQSSLSSLAQKIVSLLNNLWKSEQTTQGKTQGGDKSQPSEGAKSKLSNYMPLLIVALVVLLFLNLVFN